MKKRMIFIAAVLGVCMLAGCKKESVQEPVEEPEEFIEEYDDEDFEEYYEDEEPLDDQTNDEADDAANSDANKDNSFAVGSWYTNDYDTDSNWAMSYEIKLDRDGSAACTGWRNKDTGTFEVTGDDKVLITFDKCETDTEGEGFKPVDGFKYTIEMTIKGDDAEIKIDAPDVISNLEDGTVHRGTGSSKSEEVEDVDIADGEYITDETYKGDISADGSTVTIQTALSHYDKDWNTVLDYEKATYVIPTSKDCKCVVYHETTEESPVTKQIEFINEFLHGNSGLPITLKIKNNEIVEIGFSS